MRNTLAAMRTMTITATSLEFMMDSGVAVALVICVKVIFDKQTQFDGQ